MEVVGALFIGFEPDDILGGIFSVDFSELVVVFGTLVISLSIMVAFGNWWSR